MICYQRLISVTFVFMVQSAGNIVVQHFDKRMWTVGKLTYVKQFFIKFNTMRINHYKVVLGCCMI